MKRQRDRHCDYMFRRRVLAINGSQQKWESTDIASVKQTVVNSRR